jgi:BASS family bile acid:Na+ symporter
MKNIVQIAIFLLQISIFFVVFSLGLQTTLADATCLLRKPGLLIRSLLAMNVVMPLVAVVMAATFHVNLAVRIALVLVAVSPVPPLLPQQSKFGDSTYIKGLLACMSVLSIIVVPATIEVLGKVFARDIHISPLAVAKVMLATVLLPLAVGMLVRRVAPRMAERASTPLSGIALLVLLVAAGVLLVVALPGIIALIGNGSVLAIAVFVAIGLAVGQWLGGPDHGESTALALATASRHPGLALAIAAANFPNQRQTAVAAVLLYLIVKMLVLIPYNLWRKHLLMSSGSVKPSSQRAA